MNDIEFWQSLSSRRETLVFKDWHIQEINSWASFISDNAIFARLNYWDETLQAFNVMQVMNMMKSDEVDLAAWQVEQDIDTEQLNFLQVHRQSVEFKYSRRLTLIHEYDEQKELLNSCNLRSDDSQDK